MKNGTWLRRLPQLAVVFLAANSGALATTGLTWEKTVLERVLPVGIQVAEMTFSFTNTEKQPIRIVELQPSCGCTTATLEKQTFAPGEKGSLTVIFDGKGITGLQEKTIQVVTDDNSKPTTLILRVTIPELITVSPRLLWWSVGEEAKAKEVIVTLNQAGSAKIDSVLTNEAVMKVSLLPTDEAGKFRLVAQPVSTATPLQSTVLIQLETASAERRSYTVFTQVR